MRGWKGMGAGNGRRKILTNIDGVPSAEEHAKH